MCNARMLKEAELFCEAGLPGMLFSIVGVSVFVPFIRVDHEGDETNTSVGTTATVGVVDM